MIELRCIVCQKICEYKDAKEDCKGCGMSNKLTDWLDTPCSGRSCTTSEELANTTRVPINVHNGDGTGYTITPRK